jgi:metal-responsive CopG/Arc/MetJ family transcriptional regulator
MKEKTSITLSADVLSSIDKLAGATHSRSSFIERVLRHYLRERARAEVQARDLDRLNVAARRLNAEAEDVIDYQGMDLDSSTKGSSE